MSSVALKGYLYIFILVYHLQHGYDFWTTLSHSHIWMKLEGCTHQDWLWYHLFWNPKVHFTAWIWVMNIIDNAKSFLCISLFDELRRTMEKNVELTTMSFLLQAMRCVSDMHVWMTWQFHEGWWPNILEGYVSTRGKSITDWPSWWVMTWGTESIRG
jgi:hypothetical protein